MPYICNAALDCEKSIDAVMGRQPQKPLRYRNCVKLSKSRLPLEFRLLDSHQFLFHRGFSIAAVSSDTSISKPLNRGTLHKDRPCSPPAGVVEPNCVRGNGVDGCNVAMTSIHRNESYLLTGIWGNRNRGCYMPPLGKLSSKEMLK